MQSHFQSLAFVLTLLLMPMSLIAQQAPDVEQITPQQAPDNDQQQPQAMVGWLELSGSLRDGPSPFAWVPDDELGPSLDDVLGQLETVRANDNYLGVVIYLEDTALELSHVFAISDAITRLREADRLVMVFSESYSLGDYLLACSADMILLQHKGGVALRGLAVEEMYLAGMLEKVGIKADLIQIGKFKGADESMTRTGPSEAWSKNIDGLIDDLYDQIVTRIATGRSMSQQQVETLMRDVWTLDDRGLVSRRVVDRLVDRDLIDVTEIEFGDDFIWDNAMGQQSTNMMVNSPFALFQMLFKKPSTQTSRPTLAVIHATGPIMTGESSVEQGPFSQASIGSRTLVQVLGDALDDDNVKGAVLRLDSPGGSALASEVIWQAVREFGQSKPIYVSIDEMAASGGYYIASGADQVYVTDTSIVGSIGVVGGKLAMGGLYDMLGINVTRRTRGPMSDVFNSVEPFTAQQREAVRKSMLLVYDQFVDRVNVGRGSRLPSVASVAEGRLFTGRQAVKNGMADKVGGLDAAIADLATQLKLPADGYDLLHLPRAMSLQEFFNGSFAVSQNQPMPGTSAASLPLISLAKRALPKQVWQQVAQTLDGLLLLRDEQVLMMMPQAIIVR